MTGEQKKDILEQVRGHILEIESLRTLIEMTESWAEPRATAYSKAPVYGTSTTDKVADGAAQLADLHERMHRKMDGIAGRITAAYDIIEQVIDSIDRAILTKYYLLGLTWAEVSEKVGKDERTCRIRRDGVFEINIFDDTR